MLIKDGKDPKPGFVDPNTGYKAKTRVEIQNPDLAKNEVSCIVGDNSYGETMIALYISSTHREDLKAKANIRPGACKNAADLYFKIEVAASACAEHLAEMYGDTLDPVECAKAAREVVIEALLKHQEKTDRIMLDEPKV